jgi:hypothetical protein
MSCTPELSVCRLRGNNAAVSTHLKPLWHKASGDLLAHILHILHAMQIKKLDTDSCLASRPLPQKSIKSTEISLPLFRMKGDK